MEGGVRDLLKGVTQKDLEVLGRLVPFVQQCIHCGHHHVFELRDGLACRLVVPRHQHIRCPLAFLCACAIACHVGLARQEPTPALTRTHAPRVSQR